MNAMQNDEKAFEDMLRDAARAAWAPAPPHLAPRVMSRIRSTPARQSPPSGALRATWYRAAIAAALMIACTLIAGLLLQQPAAQIDRADVTPQADASPGPMAVAVSLQRMPEEVTVALQDVMSRELQAMLVDAWREPQQFIARLPLQGKLDYEGEHSR